MRGYIEQRSNCFTAVETLAEKLVLKLDLKEISKSQFNAYYKDTVYKEEFDKYLKQYNVSLD